MPYYFEEQDLGRFYDKDSRRLRLGHITSIGKALRILEQGFQGGFGGAFEGGSSFFDPNIEVGTTDVAEPECILCFEWLGREPIELQGAYNIAPERDRIYLYNGWRYMANSVGDGHLRYVGGLVLDAYMHQFPLTFLDRLRLLSRKRKAEITLMRYRGDFIGVDHSEAVVRSNQALYTDRIHRNRMRMRNRGGS